VGQSKKTRKNSPFADEITNGAGDRGTEGEEKRDCSRACYVSG